MMTTDPGGNGAAPDDEADLGEPIDELRGASMALADEFPARVGRRIERRLLAGSVLELLWIAPLTMLLEFLRWPLERFTDRRR
jgi:hypothetical protein